jgi:hypothetical protein
MERDYPFGLSLRPSLVRLVLHHEYREKGGTMNKGYGKGNKGQRSSVKRKGSPVRRRPSTARSRISRADRAALEQLDRLLELERRREQLAQMVPPGIETSQEALDNGTVLYHFAHEELGELGYLRIAPVPFMVPLGMVHVSAEMVPSDPDEDEQWEQKYSLFKEMVTLCVSALPGSHTVSSPLPSVEESSAQRRLYLRFLDCGHSIAMFALAKGLSESEYQQLRAAIETALVTASPSDRIGIGQRWQELQMYWSDLQARPEIE